MDNFKLDNENFKLNVDERLRPSLERQLTGTTNTDMEIQSLPIPSSPFSIKVAVHLLRVYRKYRPALIGNRCVYEPSCSHYSEIAIRENGLLVGISLTVKRLFRCRPGRGGLDLSCKKRRNYEI